MNNITDKPFKTHNQQMKILRGRNLDVRSNNKRDLEQIGYYTLINGYKWPFLRKDSNGKAFHPEQYIDNSSFKEIKRLYDFDFDLRAILYRALLKYETLLKSEISYRFSERYQEEHSYLAIDNYNRDPGKVRQVVRTINELSSTLSKNSNGNVDNAIKHYINKHGHVPLWVLSNFLTFGALNNFYKNITDEIRINIAKDFTKMHEREYKIKMDSIDPNLIDNMNKIVNFFRNVVAHGDITYSFSVNQSGRAGKIVRKLNLNDIYTPQSQAGVFELIVCLKLFIQKKDYKRLTKDIIRLVDDYKNDFSSISFNTILKDMHFPTKETKKAKETKEYKEILTK